MPRVEHIGDATLYLGDCRDVLHSLPIADAVVTDPPYGIGAALGGFGKAAKIEGNDWDAAPVDFIDRVVGMAPQAIIWGGNYYALPPASCWLVWDKETAGITTFADCEVAWTNLCGAMRLKRHLWSGPYQKVREAREHPTQKPVAIMAWSVERTIGNRILDPFMGSGTTGVAALRLGRKFIGIEIEERWFDVACRRIEAEARQGRLDVDQRPYNADADAIGSYNDAVKAIGERVKAGEPIPDLFRSQKSPIEARRRTQAPARPETADTSIPPISRPSLLGYSGRIPDAC